MLAQAAEGSDTDHDRARLATARIDNFLANFGDIERARRVYEMAQRQVSAPRRSSELMASHARLEALDGNSNAALELAEQLLDSTDDGARAAAAVVAGNAHVFDLRPTRAGEIVTAELARHSTPWVAGSAQLHPVLQRSRLALALAYAGKLEQAEEIASAEFEAVAHSDLPTVLSTLALVRSTIASERGCIRSALEWARRALSHLEHDVAIDLRRWAVAAALRASAQMGDGDVAADMATEFGRTAVNTDFDAIGIGGLGWIAWRDGRAAEAYTTLHEAAEIAIRTHHRTHAVQALFDMTVLGGAEQAVSLARDLRTDAQGDLLTAKLDVVEAAALKDRRSVIDAADLLASLGANLAAAEGFGLAATLAQLDGNPRNSERLRARARQLESLCDGAHAETLGSGRRLAVLTPREREVALLAAARYPSKVIAVQLDIRRRTVDNLLQRAYRKLGAHDRFEVAELLHVGRGPVAPERRSNQREECRCACHPGTDARETLRGDRPATLRPGTTRIDDRRADTSM